MKTINARLTNLGDELSDLGNTLCDLFQTLCEALLDYKKGKPSLLRILTIPIGALLAGFGFVMTGLFVEYRDLMSDFSRAREEKN